MSIILSPRFPKDTAFEYRLNLQNLVVVMGLGRCEKTSIDRPNVSPIEVNNLATYETILSPLKENNTDVVEKQEVVKEEGLAQLVEEVEQVEQVHGIYCVDEIEEVDSEKESDCGEDQSSAPGFKPSKREIKEVCDELKRLRINPESCLGVVRKYWANASGAMPSAGFAIARVKEAIQEGWCNNPTGLFINSCKGGVQAKNTLTADVKMWFEWARRERIVLAMSQEFVYMPDGEAVKLLEMMQKYPLKE